MTIIQTRSVASNITTLRKRVRRMVGDKESATARQRWSDAEIDQALVDELFKLYSEISEDPNSYTISSNLTYTANSASVTLPAAAQSVPIVLVEDVTNSQYVRPLTQVALDVVENYQAGAQSNYTGHVFARADTLIIVRPKPGTDLTLRISYVGNPFTPYTYTSGDPVSASATTDQHALPVAHEELICLGASIRLQEEDEEVPVTRPARYQELFLLFQKQARLFRGRRSVKSLRVLY